MYDVSTGAAYAVLYLVLSLFTVLAIISAGYCGKYHMLTRKLLMSRGQHELTHLIFAFLTQRR